MNDKGRKEDGSMRVVGRGFIIMIVVVFSSLSFTLGFFVGKNNAERKTEYSVQTAPKPPDSESPQNAVSAQPQPPKAEGRTANGETPLQDIKTAQQTVSSPPETRTGGDKTGPEHRAAESNLPKDAPQKKEVAESAETNDKSNAKPGGGEIIYTVQLEALKNAAEAHRLKTKYAKKGYKVHIAVSRNKHKEKIFKVRAGEFKEKKDAEILALRLKKNEGLTAFVTVKND